jgi:hypothetical protein
VVSSWSVCKQLPAVGAEVWGLLRPVVSWAVLEFHAEVVGGDVEAEAQVASMGVVAVSA